MDFESGRPSPDQIEAGHSRKAVRRNRLVVKAVRGIRAGIRWNYHLNKLYHQARYLSGGLRHRQPVIIYQRGKVGSSSVHKTLQRLYSGGPIFHIHFINAIERRYRQICSAVNLTPTAYFLRSDHLEVSRYLHKEIKRGLKRKKWKVITLVRDPLKQKISSFFQTIDIVLPDFHERYRNKALTVEVLTDIFLQRHKPERELDDWFHTEMSPVFGIDVFASEFPVSKGYKIYLGERADLLLIRLEDLNRCAAEAFEEFLGLTGFQLVHDNIASDKAYAVAYEEFKRDARLPDSYINAVYETQCARHFYTHGERSAFKARYLRETESTCRQ